MNDKEIKLINSWKQIATIEVSSDSSSCDKPSLYQKFTFINSDAESNTNNASIAWKKFRKRKRLMTNIDKQYIKSRFFPDKKKTSNKRDSIKDSEFDAFFSAYEEHSKGKGNNKNKLSSINSSKEGVRSVNATTNTNSPLKLKKLNYKAFRKMSVIPFCWNDTKVEHELSYSKIGDMKFSKCKRNSFYYQSTKYAIPALSNDLSCIVNSLRELENEIQ